MSQAEGERGSGEGADRPNGDDGRVGTRPRLGRGLAAE